MKLGTNVELLVIPCTPSNPSIPPRVFSTSRFPPSDRKTASRKKGDKFTNRFILQGLTKAREVEQGVSVKRVDHKNDYSYLKNSVTFPP